MADLFIIRETVALPGTGAAAATETTSGWASPQPPTEMVAVRLPPAALTVMLMPMPEERLATEPSTQAPKLAGSAPLPNPEKVSSMSAEAPLPSAVPATACDEPAARATAFSEAMDAPRRFLSSGTGLATRLSVLGS